MELMQHNVPLSHVPAPFLKIRALPLQIITMETHSTMYNHGCGFRLSDGIDKKVRNTLRLVETCYVVCTA